MSSVFGFGGVMIETVEFPYSYGNISFERVDVRNTTLTGNILVHPVGWRPIIDVNLVSTEAADAVKLASVISLIAESQVTPRTITVYPRYTSTDAGSLLSYSCYVDGNISPEDIANVDVGQTLQLRFIGSTLINSLPTNYSNPVLSIRVTNGDDDFRTYDDTDDTKIRVNTDGSA